jgi:hypothetical protein
MVKLKTYISLLLSFLAAFNLGTFFTYVKYEIKEVDTYRWWVTIIFGLYFLIIALDRLSKNKENN